MGKRGQSVRGVRVNLCLRGGCRGSKHRGEKGEVMGCEREGVSMVLGRACLGLGRA